MCRVPIAALIFAMLVQPPAAAAELHVLPPRTRDDFPPNHDR